jgi:hypothetical protein
MKLSREGFGVNTAVFQELMMENVDTLHRAAERSVRGLRSFRAEPEACAHRKETLAEFLADLKADLASLRVLRKIAGELMRDGMEAEDFLRYIEVALKGATGTLQAATAVEKAVAEFMAVDPEGGRLLIDQCTASLEEAKTEHAYFCRQVANHRTPLPPLAPGLTEKLEALPKVTGDQLSTGKSTSSHNPASAI